MFLNAGWITCGSLASAVLGFFYWVLAARFFTPTAVGYAAAALALVNFFGHLGEMGMGPLLMGDASQSNGRLNGTMSGALTVSAVGAAVLAFAYWLTCDLAFQPLGGIGGWAGGVMFILACSLAGLSLVLDQALVGVMRSELTAWRNFVQSVAKLLLMCMAARCFSGGQLNEVVLFATWLGGQLLAIGSLLFVRDRDLVSQIFGRPSFGFVKSRLGTMLGHHALTVASMGSMLLPLLVTVELAPAINAGFNAAWTLMSVAFLAPNALSVTVFAVAAKRPSDLPYHLRGSLLASLAMAVVVAVGCWLGAFFALSLFSPVYAQMAYKSLQWLGLSFFLVAIRYHYVAIQRVTGRMALASVIVAIGSLLEVGGAIAGGLYGGLVGLTLGWLAGLACTILLMAPATIAALVARPRLSASFKEAY